MEFEVLFNVSSLLWVALHIILLQPASPHGVSDIINEKNTTCADIQTKFALAAQEFTYCSISNARPITFCEKCVASYLNVSMAHQEILKGKDNSINCRDQLINVDRLQIIETLNANIEKLWSRGECNRCFEESANGSTTSNLNNVTKTFQMMNSVVAKCIKDNQPKDKPDICVICRDSYEKLNEFYNELKISEKSPSRICMDIVDSMNASRREWSEDLGCRDSPGTDVPVIVAASLMSVVPIVFYVTLWKWSTRATRIT
ncbi:osteopetrosis-associated transmembrane protein 1 [Ischnura elegans]|uniref:osteopetrosis-associated transmembrane protein 1 n=1 Tax=Ischnura elegans TaxID=197161 RepID=UPI001ED88E03|nr:osteopetrosis-associated transmembrane protein 1 [Ischnura elegans]